MTDGAPGAGAQVPRLERFLEMAGEVLVVTDFDGRLLRWNPALERTLGYGPEVLAGFTLDELIHPDDGPTRNDFAGRVAGGQEVSGVTLRSRTAGGDWRWPGTSRVSGRRWWPARRRRR